MKPSKQTQATTYVKNLLVSRNINIEPGIVLLGSDEAWQVFEYKKKCIGIDPSANVWIGPSGEKWRSLGDCTVSTALQAVDYLLK